MKYELGIIGAGKIGSGIVKGLIEKKALDNDQAAWRRSADDLPLRLSVTISNEIFWPSFRPDMPARSTALM